MVRKLIKTIPISGPMYGIKFNIAQRKAITTASFTPNIKSIDVYKVKRILICNNSPRKYLDSNDLISIKDFSILFFNRVGNNKMNIFSKYSPSLSKKKVINNTERIPIVIEPKIEPIEFSNAGIASTVFFVKPLISKVLSEILML